MKMTLNEAIIHAEEVAEAKLQDAELSEIQGCYNNAKKCVQCAEEHKQLAKWLKDYKRLLEQEKWIPVSERLPEPRVDVWVNSDIGQLQGYYEEHVGTWYASFGQGRDYLELIVNAWMPLPAPFEPKESEG